MERLFLLILQSVPRKAAKVIPVFGCIILIAVVIAWARTEKEPSYGGRSLSGWCQIWLLGYDNDIQAQKDEAAEAITKIGTNAVPFVLSKIAIEPRSPGEFSVALLRVPWIGQWLAKQLSSGGEEEEALVAAFGIWGAEADFAVPELESLALTSSNSRVVERAILCLAAIGDDALPFFRAALAKPDEPLCEPSLRTLAFSPFLAFSNSLPLLPELVNLSTNSTVDSAIAVIAIGRLELDPAHLVAALTNALSSEKFLTRVQAIRGLGDLGEHATGALPLLKALTQDQRNSIRNEALKAVEAIENQRSNSN